jgi:hypothetical protein
MQPTANSLEPNTKLPRAIRRQLERLEQSNEPQQPEDATPPDADATKGASADPAPVTPTPPDRESTLEYWKQRFKVTEGILRSERTQWDREREALLQQIDDLRSQLASASTGASNNPDSIDLGQFFTPEQVEQFGEEQCKLMAQTAMAITRTELNKQIAAHIQPLKERQQREEEDQETRARREFHDRLAELVPDYQEIDASDEWKLWLAEEDEATGMIRQKILNAKIRRKGAEGAAEVFEAFKKMREQPPEPPVSPSSSAGTPQAPVPSLAAAKGYPSAAEIKDFYKRAAIGKVSDKERSEFEARLRLPRG